MKNYLLILVLLLNFGLVKAQNIWNNKKCAVVLTYDDAINVDLDNVVPALDSLNLKGTFYLIGSSPAVANRIPEWRAAAKEGHELGNHTLFHPCDGSLPGRTFVQKDHDLNTYTIIRAVDEIRANNIILSAIDGKKERTFAYPCGDLKIGGDYFYENVKNEFVAARGVSSGLPSLNEVNLDNVNCYSINGQDGTYLVDLVKKAMETNTLLVFLFHGVGGGHNLNVSLAAHHQLLSFLKSNENEIWVAPMVDVASYIKKNKSVKIN